MEKQKIKEKAGGIMKLKEKIMNYFHQYWGKKIFMKSVSMLVVICFLVNIANLPVFAQIYDENLLNKEIKVIENQHAVTNPTAVKPPTEQISVKNLTVELEREAYRALDR